MRAVQACRTTAKSPVQMPNVIQLQQDATLVLTSACRTKKLLRRYVGLEHPDAAGSVQAAANAG